MSILDHVNSPADVKACTAEELQMLAKEIREALLNKVSQVGGPLAQILALPK